MLALSIVYMVLVIAVVVFFAFPLIDFAILWWLSAMGTNERGGEHHWNVLLERENDNVADPNV